MNAVRVLVVEDEEIIKLNLEQILTGLGYLVVGTAASGVAAIHEVREKQPDLVVIDVRLYGGMDGVEASRRIRLMSDAPIIFVTAHAATLARDLSSLPGVYGAVGKPFSLVELKSTLEDALRRRSVQ